MICLRQPGGYQYSGSMGNHKYMEVHPRQQSGSGPAALKCACSHAHVDRSDCCLEVAKQLAIIVTIRGGW